MKMNEIIENISFFSTKEILLIFMLLSSISKYSQSSIKRSEFINATISQIFYLSEYIFSTDFLGYSFYSFSCSFLYYRTNTITNNVFNRINCIINQFASLLKRPFAAQLLWYETVVFPKALYVQGFSIKIISYIFCLCNSLISKFPSRCKI